MLDKVLDMSVSGSAGRRLKIILIDGIPEGAKIFSVLRSADDKCPNQYAIMFEHESFPVVPDDKSVPVHETVTGKNINEKGGPEPARGQSATSL